MHLNLSNILSLSETDFQNKLILGIMENAESHIPPAEEEKKDLIFSEILNYIDGLIQIKTLFVLTMDTPPEDISPALTRYGRLLAHVKLSRFTNQKQVEEWCRFHNVSKNEVLKSFKERKSFTLAELYHLKENIKKNTLIPCFEKKE